MQWFVLRSNKICLLIRSIISFPISRYLLGERTFQFIRDTCEEVVNTFL